MKSLLLVIGLCLLTIIPTAACVGQVDEPYYSRDEVVAIVKQQLPYVVLDRYVMVGGEVTKKTLLTNVDLRVAGFWDTTHYIGEGRWRVYCFICFVNWFEFSEPVSEKDQFTWNFYEKSETLEYVSYETTGYEEPMLPGGVLD